jgi:CTP synthase
LLKTKRTVQADDNLTGAMSGEFDAKAKHPIVIFMPEILQTHTMRLGLRPTMFEEGSETWSKVQALYGEAGKIWEWH